MFCFFVLVVSTSAINCLEILIYQVTYYESSGMLNYTHSLTHRAGVKTILQSIMKSIYEVCFMKLEGSHTRNEKSGHTLHRLYAWPVMLATQHTD